MAVVSSMRKKARLKRLCLLAPLVSVLVLLVLVVPRVLAPVAHLDGEDSDPEDRDARVTLILLWWAPFGNKDELPDCEEGYGVRGCTLTLDRNEYSRAGAVILHHRELVHDPRALPPAPRPDGQKWIWMNFESPAHTPWLDGLERLFNLTMSYRFGSDIFLPYGYLERRPRGSAAPPAQHRHAQSGRRRRALAAWVISNWSQEQERVQFYWQLRRYIQVDIYGRQALRLVNNSVLQTISSYKFYLAFENSLHTDYITEKLWHNALESGAVPVVMGPPRENYERYLPADAFIHVHDFKSARALAAYLLYLDRNPAQYRRYLAWRRDYRVHVVSFWAEHYCAACQAVRASRQQRKTVRHLETWFQS